MKEIGATKKRQDFVKVDKKNRGKLRCKVELPKD
jgi:hypothetical protein